MSSSSSSLPSLPAYFSCVDLVRWLAALAVLFWHYQNFLMPHAGQSGLDDSSIQPFYSWFALLYDYGGSAVQLFWVISGFVMAAAYLDRTKGLTARSFLVNRFARLYPLHLATLAMVTALQWLSLSRTGSFQIYPYNDLYHFLLNLGLVSSWGFERGYSFNAPVWSVSVEIFVYVIFFLSLRTLDRKPLLMALLAVMFSFAVTRLNLEVQLANCALYFSLGILVYTLCRAYSAQGGGLAAAGIAGIVAALVVGTIRPDLVNTAYQKAFLCPAVVLLAAAADVLVQGRSVEMSAFLMRFQGLSNLTYGMYLLHVPLQIVVILILEAYDIPRQIVLEHWFLLAFILAVMGLARVVYVGFEDPMRRWLRNALARPAAPRRSSRATALLP